MDERQESRTEKVAIAVTRTEKAAVRAIAALRESDESNLCRTTPIAEVLAEYRRLQATQPREDGQDTWDKVRATEVAKRRAG